ncbi:MAG: DMT family transporter [Victivallaceae bacterium]|nr:DMT family transporter [Victivallaceae bacterium]
MKPELWALCTAACWAAGSFFEKKGVKLGSLTPVTGTTIRTVVSLIVLLALSFPYWGELRKAGPKSLIMIALGGGVLAGALGLICLYSGLKDGRISTVLTIAFCLTPVFGTVLGLLIFKEHLSLLQYAGICLCILGAALSVYAK